MAAATVKFDDGAGGDIVLPGPTPGYPVRMRHLQAVGLTAGGVRYAYEKGVTLYEVELSFETLSDSDKDNLDTFFGTTIGGASKTWTYTDTSGNTYTARFLDDSLEWTKVAQGVWSVNVRLELSTMGK